VINKIIEENNIRIPILEQIYKRLANATVVNTKNNSSQPPLIQLGNVEIKTNSTNIKTDMQDIDKSNIKFHMGINIVPKNAT
jgi:hypothetical protein